MSDSLLDEFAAFYEGLPSSVRHDLAFMLVVLADENMVVVDVDAIGEDHARSLFAAQTRLGQLGKLINAVSMFDVYFAMDAEARFRPRSLTGKQGRSDSSPPGQYLGRLEALRGSARRWDELRRTVLTPHAIAAALVPPDSSVSRRRQYPVVNFAEANSHAVP